MATLRLFGSVFKLRIGLVIMLCALGGLAISPEPTLEVWRVAVLALAVMVSSASAGAFNQLVERDLDARMGRTRGRPFVTGRLRAGPHWYLGLSLLLVAAVGAAYWATNAAAAFHVFMGAFTYGIVYTVWLKRRTWLNIVLGGLAGSFAVLAGAAAVDPSIPTAPLILAIVLFLWTPPHFWSLAMAFRKDYAEAGVPMLPVVYGDALAARVILAHTLALVALSLVPVWYGMGFFYFVSAVGGGLYFVHASIGLARDPGRRNAMAAFRASLIQLGLLLIGTMVDGWVIV